MQLRSGKSYSATQATKLQVKKVVKEAIRKPEPILITDDSEEDIHFFLFGN
jgi:hypothetical protein